MQVGHGIHHWPRFRKFSFCYSENILKQQNTFKANKNVKKTKFHQNNKLNYTEKFNFYQETSPLTVKSDCPHFFSVAGFGFGSRSVRRSRIRIQETNLMWITFTTLRWLRRYLRHGPDCIAARKADSSHAQAGQDQAATHFSLPESKILYSTLVDMIDMVFT